MVVSLNLSVNGCERDIQGWESGVKRKLTTTVTRGVLKR